MLTAGLSLCCSTDDTKILQQDEVRTHCRCHKALRRQRSQLAAHKLWNASQEKEIWTNELLMYKLAKPKVWKNIQRKTSAQPLRDRGGSSRWQERRHGQALGARGFVSYFLSLSTLFIWELHVKDEKENKADDIWLLVQVYNLLCIWDERWTLKVRSSLNKCLLSIRSSLFSLDPSYSAI